MLTLFYIWLSGFVAVIVLEFFLNRMKKSGTTLDVAVIVGIFSWSSVVVTLFIHIIEPRLKTMNEFYKNGGRK